MIGATHIIKVLKKDYTITVNCEVGKYIRLIIKWDYENGKVHIHMPGYIEKMLTHFNHAYLNKEQNSPHPHKIMQYGTKIQYADNKDDCADEKKYIQVLTGTLLYYGRAVESTILPALSSLASEQNKPTQKTMAMAKQLLDYCASQEDASITYKASKMILTSIVMRDISMKRKHVAKWADIFSCQTVANPPQVMAQFTLMLQ